MPNLKKNLKSLYPKDYQDVYKKLNKIIADFKKKNSNIVDKKGDLFSEKDIMLICYADHVKESGVKTLRTMEKFLREFAKGFINKIHFLPFFDCSDIDDGFSIKNYYKVHEPYGDWSDIEKIGKNFKFMFDFVLNHASIQGGWAQKQLNDDPKYKDYFIILDETVDTKDVFRPRTHPLLTPVESASGVKYAWTTFSEDQVDWNYKNPEALIEAVKILLYYFEQGAEAVRLDAVAYVWKKSGTSCFNLPECHTLVQIFREIFRKTAPHAWAIAETVLPHERNIEYFGDGRNESHFIYNFAMETLLMHTFLTGNSSLASKWFERMASDLGDETSMLNLSVSHDGVHIGPAKTIFTEDELMAIAKDSEKKGGKVLYRAKRGGGNGQEPYELNITYPSAIGGIEKYLASQAIQIALKGVPLIYLNNLIGAENWTGGVKKLGYSRAINRQKFDYETLAGALRDPESKQHKIYEGYKKLLEVRIKEPLFSPMAGQKMLKIDKKAVAIHRFDKKKKLIAITNVSDKKINLNANKVINLLGNKKAKDIISKKTITLNDGLRMDPYEALWLK